MYWTPVNLHISVWLLLVGVPPYFLPMFSPVVDVFVFVQRAFFCFFILIMALHDFFFQCFDGF